MGISFDDYAREGNACLDRLASESGHPERRDQAGILLRAVLHTLRDRTSVAENLLIVAQLPMFLKAIYVDQWSYSDEVDRLKTASECAQRVEEHQARSGERRFDWSSSTELPDEIAALV